MKHLELHRFKKIIGAVTFGIFFPNEDKRLKQKDGIGKQYDVVLVHVPAGKQTVTRDYVRGVTGWTQKKATAFVKEGHYPKVVMYNISPSQRIDIADFLREMKDNHGVIMEIY